MDAILIDRIETGADRAASALFGAAVGFAAYKLLGSFVLQPALDAYAVSAGAAAWLVSGLCLKAMAAEPKPVTVPVFNLREVDWLEPEEELVLTEADRLDGGKELVLTRADRLGDPDELILTDADRIDQEPLLLDNVLSEIGSESRVVRLFDPASMPTPGELKSRIDDHLGQGSAAAASADASQALSDALAELKRSLR